MKVYGYQLRSLYACSCMYDMLLYEAHSPKILVQMFALCLFAATFYAVEDKSQAMVSVGGRGEQDNAQGAHHSSALVDPYDMDY